MDEFKNSIRRFLDALDEHDYRIHALMIADGEDVIYESAAEPYILDTPHRLFSAAKSILALNAIRAVQDGLLKPEDHVADFFPEYHITDPGLKEMTVEDLLTMRTGQEGDPFGMILQDMEADLIEAFFETPTVEKPGTGFRYNNTVPHIVYAVAERAAKEPIEAYQNRYFCDPMDAPLLAPTNHKGQYNPVVTSASARTFMKFARLYLGEGTYKGKQLLDGSFIKEAVRWHTDTGMEGNSAGYGWQIWENQFGGYRMDGGWGQFAFILPEDEKAVVVLSDMTDCTYLVEAFETYLLPALRKESILKPDKEDMPVLSSIAPAGDADADGDIFGCEWKNEDLTLELNQSGNTLLLVQNGKMFTVGLQGFERNSGYTPRPFSVDHSVYGTDGSTVLLGGAWSGPRVFEFTGKCFAEMGETYCRLEFKDDCCYARYTPLAVHGIAARSVNDTKEVVLWRSRKDF